MDTIRSQTQGSNSQNSIPSDQITSNISSSQTADASRDQIASNVGSRQTANTSNTPITSATASTGVQLSTPPRVEPVVINLATPVATPSPILPNLGSHTIERPLSRVWVRSEDPPTTVTPQSRTIPVRPASATQTPPRASPDDLAQIKQLLTNLVNGQRDHETRLERHERRLAESRNITSPPPRTQLDFSTIYASGVPQAQFVTPSRPQVSQTFGPPPSSPPVGINNELAPKRDESSTKRSALISTPRATCPIELNQGANDSQIKLHIRFQLIGIQLIRNLVDSESFERFQDRTDLAFQHMSSMFHQATSSAPDIDRVIKESRRTPFSLRIKSTYIRDTSKLRIPEYSGNSDPRAYMRAFNLVVSRVPFSPEEIEAAYCRLFAENLIGPAQEWFSTLDENSIDNFDQLQSAFLKQYSIFIESKITEADLWRLSQGPKESLRSYIDRFKSVKAKITNPNEAVALLALKNNLWYESKFREELTVRPTISLDDALHRASAFATLEEDTALLREKYLKGELAYAPPGAKKTAPAKPPSQSKGQHSYSIETSAPIKSSEEEEKHCDIHNTNGHSTEECRAKGKKSSKKKGKSKTAETAVKAEKPKPKPAKDSDNAPQKREREVEVEAPDSPPSNRKRIDLIFGELSLCGGSTRSVVTPPPAPRKATSSSSHRPPRLVGGIEHSYRSSPVTSPTSRPDTKSIAISCLRRLHKLSGGVEPPTPKRIDFICGGSKMCKDSINSIKAHQRRVESSGQPRPLDGPDHEIKFRESETLALDKPHDDALVIELAVAGFELTRVMIDTGSSVDVLFYDAFKRMGFENSALIGGRTPLTGFAGETTYSMGTIQLPIKAGGITKTVDFVVVDRPAPFNAILGRPWLYTMKAVASTYHQCVKFPTPWGTKTIRGCQRASRDCYMGSYLRAEKSPVCIDETDPERRVGIGIDLAKPIRDELIAFLKENISTFAWSTADMPGIDTRITSHELNVDPTFKPMKQKRRKLGPDRAKAVNDEVDRLLKVGSIREVKYPDCYPLPHIDRLVEATAGHQLLSFMDAFSGYNQIKMNPEDQEKTAFITDRGTYCYKVMPFGLKNAGATYQRLVNKMFADQLGKTMEVYIDDMLVKSSRETDHVAQLRVCFSILNKYGMKLNPTKCTFGVPSGEFLGYLVTERGIEANPKQISALLDMPSPENTREVQRLTGRIAALNRFISRSTDKCLPFYQLLRGNKKFLWDEKCEEAFKQLKTYLSEPPILAKPVEGEPLYLYIAVSPAAVSGVLVREELNEQRPIFYVSKSLIDAETRYPAMEKLALAIVMSARKLRPYFQSHTIVVMTSQPLRTMLHSPSQSGRLAKWAIELSEYDIEYRTRTCAKAQVLADFMIELAPEANNDTTLSKVWTLFVDGASSKQGAGVGIKLTSPTGEVIEQSFRLGFVASNNEAEYEALIAGLRLAIGIGVNEINAFSDSQLVTSQYSGEYEAKEERMEAYLKVVRDLAGQFSKFELTRVPRGENTSADALAALASTSDPTVRRVIPVEGIDKPSIDIALKSDSINAITSRPSTRSQTRQSQDPGPSNPEPDSEEEEPDQDRQKTRYIDSDSSQNTQESTIHTVPSAMANELTLKEEFAARPDWRTPNRVYPARSRP
ncbi:unnamed protein product [Microthlaspi erraticum]|uniref:RNase H type-1 domain-containing protein n=1 Tax=Microthlaspi erraticum TaxID=1685480 RepID=A0A6D2KWC1_9BRAS|nr:unnamed protein product [Microthlaspi erraticum]